MEKTNKIWYIAWAFLWVIIGYLSFQYNLYPHLTSMCIILGVTLGILIDSMGPISGTYTYPWRQIWREMRIKKIPTWKYALFIHSKIVFPTILTLYLILLIVQKLQFITPEWRSYATITIENLQLLWVTLISAFISMFPWLPEEQYQIHYNSPLKNTLTVLFVCLLAYGGMWSVFLEISHFGQVAPYISLGVGMLIALISISILSEDIEPKNTTTIPNSSPNIW